MQIALYVTLSCAVSANVPEECITKPWYALGMQCPKAALFDLDDTLAESFQAPKPAVKASLSALQALIPVAIITGAGFERIEKDVLTGMDAISSNFYLFPNSSAQCFMYADGIWEMKYSLALSEDERTQIKGAIQECLDSIDVLRDAPHFGEQVVDREAQIAFTVVGLEAPQEVKKGWDPDGTKRRTIVEILNKKLDGFDILIGGASTIDITRQDINKAHGVEWFAKYLDMRPQEMLYLGDALYEGGNDYVVIQTGIQTISVANPGETAKILEELVTVCAT